MDERRELHGGLIGCGHIAPFHLRAWSRIEGVKIVALANRTAGKAERLAADFGIGPSHVYSDYAELLRREELDFIDIATAPEVHRRHVEAAAARGVHVLCQKPFAPSLEDARAMIEACSSAGVLLSINDNWRWRSWYREIKLLLDKGTVGRPRYACIRRHNGLTLPGPNDSLPRVFLEQPYMRDMDKLIVYEWGIHLIDVLRFLFGEVESIYARLDKVHSNCRGEERATVLLRIGGMSGLVDISWATIGSEQSRSLLEGVTIEGDEGTIELLPDQGEVLQVSTRGGVRRSPAVRGPPEEAYQESFTAAQRNFAECLRAGKAPETAAEDNVKSLAAALAAYESAAADRVIVMAEYRAR